MGSCLRRNHMWLRSVPHRPPDAGAYRLWATAGRPYRCPVMASEARQSPSLRGLLRHFISRDDICVAASHLRVFAEGSGESGFLQEAGSPGFSSESPGRSSGPRRTEMILFSLVITGET